MEDFIDAEVDPSSGDSDDYFLVYQHNTFCVLKCDAYFQFHFFYFKSSFIFLISLSINYFLKFIFIV